jgi:hypothetical protein
MVLWSGINMLNKNDKYQAIDQQGSISNNQTFGKIWNNSNKSSR